MRSWIIRKWNNKPTIIKKIELSCPHCETDAEVPCGAHYGGQIIAAIGLQLVFDPPGFIPPFNFLPDEIQCRKCRHIFVSEEPNPCTASSSAVPSPAQ